MSEEQEILNLALQHYREKNYRESEILLNQVLAQNSSSDTALYFLGLISYIDNHYDEAVKYIGKAVRINPKADYYKDLGNILFDIDQKEEAISCYNMILALNPDDSEIHYNLALIYQDKKLLKPAISHLENVIRLEPDDVESYNRLGIIYYNDLKNIDEAIKYFEKAININPDYADGYFNLGLAYNLLKDTDKAVKCYLKTVELVPDYLNAYFNLGILSSNNPAEAVKYFKKVIELNPDYAEAFYNLAKSFQELEETEKAVNFYKKAIELKPDFAEAYNNLGTVLNKSDYIEEAVTCFKKAIKLKPDYLDSYNNLGDLYRYRNQTEKAFECYEKALEFDLENPDAITCIGLLYLQKKDFEKGWKFYESRFNTNNKFKPVEPKLSKPRWNGIESLNGKTIYVYCEQGLGDSILFARFLPVLADMGAKVLFKVQPGLEKLFEQSDLKAEIIGYLTPDDSLEFDTYIPLVSLPYALKTQPANIPYSSGYLKADPEKVTFYKEKYFNNNLFKIGINWQCKNIFHQDLHRSIPDISYFYKIARLQGLKIYSLQKGKGVEQLDSLPEDVEIINLGKTFNDFSDTAAAIKNLDLIISVDTSVPLLSGALGKPTWILIEYAADWKWFLDSNDSPWFKNVKLFRQKSFRIWDYPVENIYNNLITIL